MTTAKSVKEFKKSGEYLPEFMRYFHDQKLLFKYLDVCIQKSKVSGSSMGGSIDMSFERLPDWISAQIYVIDYFLWIMAQHGYTLQKSRKHIEGFDDIENTLKRYQIYLREREGEQLGMISRDGAENG